MNTQDQIPTTNQIVDYVKQFNASNFFSTQPEFKTVNNFFVRTHNFNDPKTKSNTFNTKRSNQSPSLNRTFNKLQEIIKDRSCEKIKKVKLKLKQAKSVFINQLQYTHRKLKNCQDLRHDTSLLKNKFINLYELKKYKLDTQQIMIKGKAQKQDFMRSSYDFVRIKKKQRQNSLYVLRNSESDLKYRLQKKNFTEKQQLKQKLSNTFYHQRKWKLGKVNEVLQSSNQLLMRKKQFQKLRKMKAYFNHSSRIKDEQQLIGEYQKILKNFQSQNPQMLKVILQRYYTPQKNKNEINATRDCSPNQDFLTQIVQMNPKINQKQFFPSFY